MTVPDPSVPEPVSIPEMFWRRVERDPDREFLILPTGQGWTLRQLADRVDRLAERLIAAGVGHGDVVGQYFWNDPAWFVSALATWRCGAMAALCGAVSPATEAVRRFDISGARVVVSADAPALGSGLTTIELDPSGALLVPGASSSAALTTFEPFIPKAEDRACIFFTSGTTGDAKGIVKTHGEPVSGARRTAETYSRSAAFRPNMAAESKPAAPAFHPFGNATNFGRTVFYLYVGRPLVMVRKFELDTFQEVARRFRPDTLQLTPAMVYSLAYANVDVDVSALQYITCGTAPLSTTVRDAFEERYGVPVLQAYGSTEGGVMALESAEDVRRGWRGPGSVGRITAESEWRIVDPSGEDVAAGELGEILGKPPSLTTLSAEGETELPVDQDGWYRTGDLGRVDEHGILYITGRIKDVIIVGGSNVFPLEVEQVLRGSDSVREAMVLPVADARLGEIPTAGIVWADADAFRDLAAEFRALDSLVRDNLAPYKVPRRWMTLADIPLTPNGKPDRVAAARLAAERAKPIDQIPSAS